MSWEEFASGPTKLLRVRVFRRHASASVRFPPRVDFIPNSYFAFRLFSVKRSCFAVEILPNHEAIHLQIKKV